MATRRTAQSLATSLTQKAFFDKPVRPTFRGDLSADRQGESRGLILLVSFEVRATYRNRPLRRCETAERMTSIKPLSSSGIPPSENRYCEGFNARFREEQLDGEICESLRQARILIV